jgi:hypothetical protein
MGDASIAQDLIEGVTDALADLGGTRTVQIYTEGALNPINPGAGKPKIAEDLSVEALLYDYEDSYIDGQTVLRGDRKAIIDIAQLTPTQLSGVAQGAVLIDGSDRYTVVGTSTIEVAGVTVTIILQIRGA